MDIPKLADEHCDDEWVLTDEGMHPHDKHYRDSIEDRRKVDGRHPQHTLRKQVQEKVRNALGNECDLCGEDRVHLLDVHHVELDGKEERRMNHITMWRHIWREVKNGSSRYQLLCKNCHADIHHQLK